MIQTVCIRIDAAAGLREMVCNVSALRGFARMGNGVFRMFYLKQENGLLEVAAEKRGDVRSEELARLWINPRG